MPHNDNRDLSFFWLIESMSNKIFSMFFCRDTAVNVKHSSQCRFQNLQREKIRTATEFYFMFLFLHKVHIYDVQGCHVLRNSCIRNFQFTEVTPSAIFFFSLFLFMHQCRFHIHYTGTICIALRIHFELYEYHENTIKQTNSVKIHECWITTIWRISVVSVIGKRRIRKTHALAQKSFQIFPVS